MTADSSALFEDLPQDLADGIRDLGWSSPMPVQAKVVPLMRAGGDLIVQARTGSGKTGAFGIPIVERVETDRAVTQALVLAPTRELAGQVAAEVTALGKHRGVRCLPIYGGVGYGPQIDGLKEGAHVVVGTPGRILDHMGAGRLVLDDLKVIVFDEADEMLSLGFWPDMREIHSYLPQERQSCLFSATIPEKVRSLSRFFLTDPEFVTLSEGQVAPQEIEHFFYLTTAQEKDATLARIIEYEDPESAIIFCNTKDDVRYVCSYLQRKGFDADQISGDLTQAARETSIAGIKAGELRFLVATDVAARGIDISDLTHVISYAAPGSPEVYVHRTGRTGRAGKAGVAISLVSGLDIGDFRHLQNVTKIEVLERPIPSDADIAVRLRERLEVKVEQEMRAMPARERADKVDRFIPVVEQMVSNEEGRRDLAAVCAAYLREHKPETTIRESDPGPQPAAEPKPEPRRGRGGGGRGGGRGGGSRRGKRRR
ncbi:MAG: DEAD/DEAH box helicase [Proteobacteria bacterium]|nr:DEAD/DEAH box helicase [Pseudomonadota bacterium]